MGVTSFEIGLLQTVIENKKPLTVLELGAQNNYSTEETAKPPFMSEWYKQQGIEYNCIDLAGDNKAFTIDLSKQLTVDSKKETFFCAYDLVTDFGTSEHVVQMNEYEVASFHEGYINSIYPKGAIKDIKQGYFNCWVNKHNLLKKEGIMISVNPLTGHWKGHGFSYLGEEFYKQLALISGYEVIVSGVNCAMGNCIDGKNVYAVLKKTSSAFPNFDNFYTLPIYEV